MNIKRERVNAKGKRELVVELDKDEFLMPLAPRGYYRLGGQIDDVVEWHVIADSIKVYWCHFEQKWVDA